MKYLLQLARLRHWIKNLLIFAPLFFVGNPIHQQDLIEGSLLFLAFSLLASSIYVMNDLVDAPSDRLHPAKKHRPIAAKTVSRNSAILFMIILLGLVIAMSFHFPIKVIIILGVYFICNVLYSTWLKHVVIVDIFLISIMYLMRIYAGSKLWDIPLSHWIILCTFFATLFMITAKRRAELNALETGGGQARSVIKLYDREFLDHALTITLTATLVAYGLYTVSTARPYMLYALFFVTFGLMRYLYLIYHENIGQTPEDILLKDFFILGSFVAWVLYNAAVIYIT